MDPGTQPGTTGDPGDPGASTTRRRSAVALLLLLAMFALGALMEGSPEGATLFGVAGPPCPSRLLLPDAGCPGCGLTRATAMFLDGDPRGATEVHAGVWLVVVLGALGTLLRAAIVLAPQNSAWTHRPLRSGRVLFLGGLLAVWLVRLLP